MIFRGISCDFFVFAKMHPTDKTKFKNAVEVYYGHHKTKGKAQTAKIFKNMGVSVKKLSTFGWGRLTLMGWSIAKVASFHHQNVP